MPERRELAGGLGLVDPLALAQGVIAPTVVEVVGARIRLSRDAEGNFAIVQRVASGEAAESGAEFSELLPAIVQQLLSKPTIEASIWSGGRRSRILNCAGI